jgi:hypothetical protein
MGRKPSAQWTWVSSLFLVLVLCDLLALTCYLWALPDHDLLKWKKVVSTVGAWLTSLFTFLGVKRALKNKYSGAEFVSMLPVRPSIAVVSLVIWFFVLPFHSLDLTVADIDSSSAIRGVATRVDNKGSYDSDEHGMVHLSGLLAAPHTVHLEKTGYKSREWSSSFADVLAWHASRILLETLRGRAVLDSVPQGAAIFLDGAINQQGTTPQTLELAAGEHTVQFRKDNYIPTAWEPITIGAKDESHLVRELTRSPQREYALTVVSDPMGASIYVDSQFEGTTNYTIKVAGGKHRVELKMHGFVPVEDKVTIPDQSVATYQMKKSE